jgi:preprotein translocase subunit YajC
MFAIFYFLLIRPQQKKAKQHKAMLAAVKKGDKVITSGGLHGEITGMTDDAVTMEIAPKVRVKVSRGAIAGVLKRGEPGAESTSS